MERLKYTGAEGPKRVKIPRVGEVSRGESLSVPSDTAKRLLQENPKNWEPEKPPKKEQPAAGPDKKAAKEG